MALDAEDGGLAVERFRSYLLLLVRTRLRGFPDARINASDVVQQTLLDAYRQRQQFRGEGPSEMAAWLRRMLACNLADAHRALHRGKRDVERERSLEAELAESSARLASWLASDQSSPSQQAVRNEQELHVSDALAALPDAQREAIVLHYWQGCSLAETAQQLGRSPAAVAGLLHRGLKTLRGLLTEQE
jgi:RNA polymerase sigma-70 factor (ECF subfamily)